MLWQGTIDSSSYLALGTFGRTQPAFQMEPKTQWKRADNLSNVSPTTENIAIASKEQFESMNTGPNKWQPPYADLSEATAATINQLREAFQIQRLYERDARGGTRYIEIIRSHFGVISPDARLQRPEYLGGGSASVNINPVAPIS